MSSRLNTIALSIVIALAMAFGWLLPHQTGRDFKPAISFVESSFEEERLSASALERHSHDADDNDNRGSGTVHAHNNAEHLHETPDLAAGIVLKPRPLASVWYSVLRAAAARDTTYEFLRPPRALPPSREA